VLSRNLRGKRWGTGMARNYRIRAAGVPVSSGRVGEFSQLLALPPHQTSGRNVALAGLQQFTHSGRGNPTSVLGIAVAPRKRPNRPVDRAQQSGATSRYPLQALLERCIGRCSCRLAERGALCGALCIQPSHVSHQDVAFKIRNSSRSAQVCRTNREESQRKSSPYRRCVFVEQNAHAERRQRVR
jgi:hypothetical protein